MNDLKPMAARNVNWMCAQVSPDWLERINKEPDNYFTRSEKDRISTFRFPKRLNEWLAGRLVAKFLFHRLNEEYLPNEIEVRNDPSGAPYYKVDQFAIQGSLSISHSGSFACAAYIDANFISAGIDLEQIEPRASGFIDDYFTPKEIHQVNAQTNSLQPLWINLIWSLKESFLKSLKMGLRRDTREINILLPGIPAEKQRWIPAIIQDLRMPGNECRAWWRYNEQIVITLVANSTQRIDLNLAPVEIPFSGPD